MNQWLPCPIASVPPVRLLGAAKYASIAAQRLPVFLNVSASRNRTAKTRRLVLFSTSGAKFSLKLDVATRRAQSSKL